MRRNNPKPVPFLNPAEPGSSIRPGESAAYMHRPPCGQQGFCTFLSTAVKAANSGVYRRLSHAVMRPHGSGSEKRREGQEWVRTCTSGCSPSHYNKTISNTYTTAYT